MQASNGVNGLKTPLMLQLSESLAKDVASLTRYLDSVGHGQPSWERTIPINVLPPDAPTDIQIARESIMDTAMQLLQLAAGPAQYNNNIKNEAQDLACLRWLCSFRVFTHVPLEGSISYAELATLVGAPQSRLKSVMRMAMTSRLFIEPSPQHVAHSATSALFAANPNFHDQINWTCGVVAPSAWAMAEAHQKWPQDTDNTHTPFNLAFGSSLPFYDEIARHPEFQRNFHNYHTWIANATNISDLKHLVNGFDWSSLGNAVVVDVGGSQGHAAVALAEAFPDLNLVIQDLPHVIQEGKQYINSLPNNSLPTRIIFQEHNFFNQQPVKGADVYILRQILHNWSFDDAVKILSNIVPAMNAGRSRIAIMDSVLPAPGTSPVTEERMLRGRDLRMVQLFNANERAIEDWRDILATVDKRLKLESVVRPAGSILSVLSVVLSDE